MRFLTFKGGIHPPYSKKMTENLAIEDFTSPEYVQIPMQQHIGAPCQAVVKKGDEVKMGQLIGEPQGFVSASIHSSVSGIVKEVKEQYTAYGLVPCITIENDGRDEVHESVKAENYKDMSSKAIVEKIKQAGIVGMGGAGFPTHVKLSPPENKPIDTVILNGAECEPYLTCDHRMMLENPGDIVEGLQILMKAVNAQQGIIGIETNTPDAIESIEKAVKGTDIKLVVLETKYPQGAEKQLIDACVKREVPSGGLPMDVGVVVNNVSTAATICRVFKEGMPLVERVCTVTGSAIKNPKNIRFRVGTPIKQLIEWAGGFKENPGKIILGGPMMGVAQTTDEIPSMKNTSGVLVFNEKDARIPRSTACIRCGRCIHVCPTRLMPVDISAFALLHKYDQAEELNAMDCIECGSCAFICPSKRPLLESIRVSKKQIIAKRKK